MFCRREEEHEERECIIVGLRRKGTPGTVCSVEKRRNTRNRNVLEWSWRRKGTPGTVGMFCRKEEEHEEEECIRVELEEKRNTRNKRVRM